MATQKKFVVKNGLISQSNVDITGNITVSGTVDGRNISTDGTKLDGIPAGANVYTDSNVNTYLGANGYGTSASIIASITASAPATLDTLNELAAALNDDANFSTTVTNQIATKATLAEAIDEATALSIALG
tara:strand:- start:1264 stop:1656 length:393 start_codon:yes stop_codon:yes gene_type:complete